MKVATKLAIVCLSIGALLTFSENWWIHWLSSSEFFSTPALRLILAATDVLLLQVPLIIFFVALYRRQGQDGMR
jgi:hypothetical protein